MSINKKNNFFITILIFVSISILGFLSSLQGPSVPYMVIEMKTDYASVGSLLAIGLVGYLLGTVAGGMLTDKFGYKSIFLLAYVLSGLGSVLMTFANSFALIIVFFTIMQFGLGLFQVLCNGLAAVRFTRNTAVMFSFLHLCYGLGSMLGAEYSGRLLAKDYSWTYVFLLSAAISLVMIIYTLFVRIPINTESSGKGHFKLGKIIRDRRLWAWSAVLGGAAFLGLGIVNWMPNYLFKMYSFPIDKASTYLTMFFALYTGGRLFTGFITKKTGYMRFLWVSTALSMLSIAAGLIIKKAGEYLIVLSGIFTAGLFPTIMAALTTEYTKDRNLILGFSIAFGRVIAMGGNYFIGTVSNELGLTWGFAVIPVLACIFASAGFSVLLQKKHNKTHTKSK